MKYTKSIKMVKNFPKLFPMVSKAKKKYKKHPLIIFIMAHCSIAILVLAGLCIAVVSGFSLSKSKARGVA